MNWLENVIFFIENLFSNKKNIHTKKDSDEIPQNSDAINQDDSQPIITAIVDETIKELYVDFEADNRYNQVKLQYFPIVLFPEKNCIINLPVNGKNSNVGITENSFCKDFLLKYFNDSIHDNLSFFVGETRYEPDISFIDSKSGKNIYIDIEIDEPYEGVTRLPTHYKTVNGTFDDFRNKEFNNRGWIVIRFAEQQIVTNPKSCCKYLWEIIKSINPDFTYCNFSEVKDLQKIVIWNEEEAIKMAENKFREKYLGIVEFFKSNNTRNYTITDSPGDIEIEISIDSAKSKENIIQNEAHFDSIEQNKERSTNDNVEYGIFKCELMHLKDIKKPVLVPARAGDYYKETINGRTQGYKLTEETAKGKSVMADKWHIAFNVLEGEYAGKQLNFFVFRNVIDDIAIYQGVGHDVYITIRQRIRQKDYIRKQLDKNGNPIIEKAGSYIFDVIKVVGIPVSRVPIRL